MLCHPNILYSLIVDEYGHKNFFSCVKNMIALPCKLHFNYCPRDLAAYDLGSESK